MSTSIGIHVILPTDEAKQAIRLAPWAGVIAVNDPSSLEPARTAGIPLRILRDTATDSFTPVDAATHLLDHDWTNVTAMQLACESGASDAWDWQMETVRCLRARGWTHAIIGGAWSTGHPSDFDRTSHRDGSPHFPALLPFAPVFAATDYFALHGYVGCLPGDAAWPDAITWYACRHRLYNHCLAQHGITVPRWIYTERGLDRVQGRTAAGRDGVTAQQYAALVAALAAEDAKDGIPFSAYFTLGPTPDWAAFAWGDAVPAIAAGIAGQANTPPESRQDAPGSPIAPKEAPVIVGIDISSLQPNTDWPQVAQSHRFAFIKATEGAGYVNPYFGRDWAGARAAGVIRGAYHFARPDAGNTPQAEADYFLATVGALSTGDLLALDLEVGDGDLSGWALAWLRRVEQRVGFAPFLYSYPDFILTRNLRTSALAAYPLWYASYQQQWPPTPGQWSSVAVWQHSDNATVPGVAGIVDESYSALTVEQLRALGKPAPAVAQGATVDALAYYQQLGVKIDPTHGVYLYALKPLWDYYQAHKDDVVDGVPVGDLIKPGALIFPEYGAIWGNGRPAACVKLENRVVGVYQAEDGSWDHPYQARLS